MQINGKIEQNGSITNEEKVIEIEQAFENNTENIVKENESDFDVKKSKQISFKKIKQEQSLSKEEACYSYFLHPDLQRMEKKQKIKLENQFSPIKEEIQNSNDSVSEENRIIYCDKFKNFYNNQIGYQIRAHFNRIEKRKKFLFIGQRNLQKQDFIIPNKAKKFGVPQFLLNEGLSPMGLIWSEEVSFNRQWQVKKERPEIGVGLTKDCNSMPISGRCLDYFLKVLNYKSENNMELLQFIKLQVIKSQSNMKGQAYIKNQGKKYRRINQSYLLSRIKDIDYDDITLFVGSLLYMEHLGFPRIYDYFSQDLQNLPSCLQKYVSKEFFFLMLYLLCVQNDAASSESGVQQYQDLAVSQIKNLYKVCSRSYRRYFNPYNHICLYLRYLEFPSIKSNKQKKELLQLEFKILYFCDSRTGYIFYMAAFQKNEPQEILEQLIIEVLKDLSPQISQYDFHVYTDKNLTSFSLAQKLMEINISLTGILDTSMLSKNFKYLPTIDFAQMQNFVSESESKCFQLKSGLETIINNSLLLCIYKINGSYQFMISTSHDCKPIKDTITSCHKNEDSILPNMYLKFLKYFINVNKYFDARFLKDPLISPFKVAFFSIFKTTTINSYIIYRLQRPYDAYFLQQFEILIVKQSLENYQKKHPIKKPMQIGQQQRKFALTSMALQRSYIEICQYKHHIQKSRYKGYCIFCYETNQNYIEQNEKNKEENQNQINQFQVTKHKCVECQLYLHRKECFKKFHEYQI